MTKSQAIHHAFEQARFWQLVGCASVALLILALIYIAAQQVKIYACYGTL